MKKIYVFLCYLIMIVMCFTFTIPILDSKIGGDTLRIICYYFFVFTFPIFLFWCILVENKKVNRRFFYIFFFIAFSCIMSIRNQTTFVVKLSDGLLFIIPMLLCCVAEYMDCDRKKCLDYLFFTNIVAGVVSVLAATGLLDLDLWAAQGALARTAGVINSTLGVGGFSAALILLFGTEKGKKIERSNLVLQICGFIGSLLVVLFSLSRTRIVLLLIICVAFFVYNLFFEKTLAGIIKILAFMLIFSIIVLQLFPEVTSMLIDAIKGRYSLGNDVNIQIRNEEQYQQLQLFAQHPFFGSGWGNRVGKSIYGESMYIHNIYTALLMQTGIVGTFLYLAWQISYFKVLFKALNLREFRLEAVIGLAFLLSLVVLGFPNAGLTQSGAYFMMFFVAALVKDIEKKANEDVRAGKGGSL